MALSVREIFELLRKGRMGDVKEKLRQGNWTVNQVFEESMGNSLLQEAIQCRLPDMVSSLVESASDVNYENNFKRTPLYLAVAHDAGKYVLSILMQNGGEIWSKDVKWPIFCRLEQWLHRYRLCSDKQSSIIAAAFNRSEQLSQPPQPPSQPSQPPSQSLSQPLSQPPLQPPSPSSQPLQVSPQPPSQQQPHGVSQSEQQQQQQQQPVSPKLQSVTPASGASHTSSASSIAPSSPNTSTAAIASKAPQRKPSKRLLPALARPPSSSQPIAAAAAPTKATSTAAIAPTVSPATALPTSSSPRTSLASVVSSVSVVSTPRVSPTISPNVSPLASQAATPAATASSGANTNPAFPPSPSGNDAVTAIATITSSTIESPSNAEEVKEPQKTLSLEQQMVELDVISQIFENTTLSVLLKPDALGYQLVAVYPHGSAGRVGLKKNDVIMAVDGQPIRTRDGLRKALENINGTWPIQYHRNGKPETVDVRYIAVDGAVSMSKTEPKLHSAAMAWSAQRIEELERTLNDVTAQLQESRSKIEVMKQAHESQMCRLQYSHDTLLAQCIPNDPENSHKNFVMQAKLMEHIFLGSVEYFPKSDLEGPKSKWKQLKSHAKGGFGIVYKGTYKEKPAALKVAVSDSESMYRDSLKQEAAALVKVRHQNVVRILAAVFGQTRDTCYVHGIITEWVEGDTLGTKIKQKSLTVQQSLWCALGLAEALEAVHACGLAHRDCSPSNIIVFNNFEVKLIDFGLARIGGQITKHADAGTAHYRAPEVADGKASTVDSSVDVYSFGVMLGEMLTGRWPLESFPVVNPPSLQSPIKSLISSCVSHTPQERPVFSVIVQQLREFVRMVL